MSCARLEGCPYIWDLSGMGNSWISELLCPQARGGRLEAGRLRLHVGALHKRGEQQPIRKTTFTASSFGAIDPFQ